LPGSYSLQIPEHFHVEAGIDTLVKLNG
jgi:hypothetical protein